jgi:hypothetical protein
LAISIDRREEHMASLDRLAVECDFSSDRSLGGALAAGDENGGNQGKERSSSQSGAKQHIECSVE